MIAYMEQEREIFTKHNREMMLKLPKEVVWTSDPMYQYQGFWYTPMNIEGVLWAQQKFYFDLHLLASTPKSGITWLKALIFSIVNRTRTRFDSSTHPLLTSSPHKLVPLLEFFFHWNIPYDHHDPNQLIFQTHIPFTSLPKSIIDHCSQSRIIYLCRNPKDVFVSMYFFKEILRLEILTPFH